MFFLLCVVLLLLNNVYAHEASDAGLEITLNEQLGSYVPMDIPFYGEKGENIVLKNLINKPTVIAPVYLSCTNTCPLLLLGLADVIEKSKLKPGKDYRLPYQVRNKKGW